MNYELPQSLKIGSGTYEIRADYRAVLDILAALGDAELTEREKTAAVLTIFYPACRSLPPEDRREALERCFWFINGGEEDPDPGGPRLMDWEQDFPFIVAPVNRVLGREIREIPYDFRTNAGGLHWWSFLAAYREIGGDCCFAQIVALRDKLARHKKLDKADREWLRQNRRLVEFRRKTSQAEEELLKKWI